MCNHGPVRRWLIVLIATLSLGLAAVSSPVTHADYTPWFAPKVGNATQVISVVGDGGSSAKVDVFAADRRRMATGQGRDPGIRGFQRHGPADP